MVLPELAAAAPPLRPANRLEVGALVDAAALALGPEAAGFGAKSDGPGPPDGLDAAGWLEVAAGKLKGAFGPSCGFWV